MPALRSSFPTHHSYISRIPSFTGLPSLYLPFAWILTPLFYLLLQVLIFAAVPVDFKVFPVSSQLPAASQPSSGFTRLFSSNSGIHFTNSLAAHRSLTNHILMNGSGVAAGDIDGDGRCDLYFCGLDGPNALFRNLGGWKFTNITVSSGVECRDMDCTGAVFADIDGDGDLDLLVSAIRRGVTCFLNDGKGVFSDATERSGLAPGNRMGSMTLALADIDGDGDLDLYVSNYRNETLRDGFRMQLRVGNVKGTKTVTMVNGQPLAGPELAGWVTLDPQGNIVENGQADALYLNDGHGRFTPVDFTQGAFLDESGRPLSSPPYDWTLTAMFRDINGDHAPDLYICSDLASPDRIWINQGDGRFRAARPTSFRKTSWFSMGVDFADLNRDGHDDLFVTDMVSRNHLLRHVQVSNHQPVLSQVGDLDNRPQSPRNTLFVNTGDGDFLETAYYSQLDATDWSWAPVFLDVDLDGYEDVLITTGFERDVQDIDIANELEELRRQGNLSDADGLRIRSRFPRLALANLAYRNNHDLTFQDMSHAWRFDSVGVSQGIALADLDQDGDLDVVVNNSNEEAGIYRNDASAPRIAVRLAGTPPNSHGIGARILVHSPGLPVQSQEIQSGGRYLSSDEAVRTFAVLHPTNTVRIEIIWRNGATSSIDSIPANCIVQITEPNSSSPPPAQSQVASSKNSHVPTSPWFEDATRRLNHRHHESLFDDFQRQALLPRKLSQSGPGIAWGDIDSDGLEDLIIGSGRGGELAMLRNDGQGGFTRLPLPPQLAQCDRDLTGILCFPVSGSGGALGIIIAESNYEADPSQTTPSILRWLHPSSQGFTNIPVSMDDIAALSLGDIDGDGQLELFVGGRSRGGRYPEPVASHLYRFVEGQWKLDSTLQPILQELGYVNGALFSDLEGDGFPELIVTTEWGPIHVFKNIQGKLEPWNPNLLWNHTSGDVAPSIPDTAGNVKTPLATLKALTGWWNGVAAGDFNNDGRLDLIIANAGRNLKQERYRSKPLKLFYGDLSESGNLDLLETYWEPSMSTYVPWMHLGRIRSAIPSIAARFNSFRQFGNSGIDSILGDQRERSKSLEVSWFESTLLINETNGLRVVPLEMLAQWSPASAVCIADYNGDGFEDCFLSQNWFATEPETSRFDGGRGLCLAGDGSGQLRALSGAQSGLIIYGEQRSAAVADYDADGRPDLGVTQNGQETRLFHNVGAKPGLRVRLTGPPGNPSGIGAVLRLRYNSHWGPARELHAGSGYWSQDSSVAVLGLSGQPLELEVRWPGGRISRTPLEPGKLEVKIAFSTAATRSAP